MLVYCLQLQVLSRDWIQVGLKEFRVATRKTRSTGTIHIVDSMKLMKSKITCKPVTMNEWQDLETLFNENYITRGCWCMYWRIKRSLFNKQLGKANKRAMKKLIALGEVPGILAYYDGNPIGWCSIAPREAYATLERSRVLKRVDDLPVWSIVCFDIAKEFQHAGLMAVLIKVAIAYAKKNGARIVEAYPLIPEKSRSPKWEAYTGIITTFRRLGFKKVLQRSRIRPIMRFHIK